MAKGGKVEREEGKKTRMQEVKKARRQEEQVDEVEEGKQDRHCKRQQQGTRLQRQTANGRPRWTLLFSPNTRVCEQ